MAIKIKPLSRHKEIKMFDLEGKHLKTFARPIDAAKYLIDTKLVKESASLSSVLHMVRRGAKQKEIKSYAGFQWRYSEDMKKGSK